jgi:hypothetical protein
VVLNRCFVSSGSECRIEYLPVVSLTARMTCITFVVQSADDIVAGIADVVADPSSIGKL